MHALEAFAADALYTGRRQDTFHWVEPILEHTVNGLDLLLKAVVSASQRLVDWHHLARHRHLHRHTIHLLLEVLDEGWLHHVDAMVALDLFAVMQQE